MGGVRSSGLPVPGEFRAPQHAVLQPGSSGSTLGRDFASNFRTLLVTVASRPVDHPLNTILYGPPGTGKAYATFRRCVQICDGRQPGQGT